MPVAQRGRRKAEEDHLREARRHEFTSFGVGVSRRRERNRRRTSPEIGSVASAVSCPPRSGSKKGRKRTPCCCSRCRRPESRFVADAADDQVRMLVFGRKEEAGRLDDSVTGLNDLLSGREVLADQHIEVFYLRHD
jgi:hypothetical protein